LLSDDEEILLQNPAYLNAEQRTYKPAFAVDSCAIGDSCAIRADDPERSPITEPIADVLSNIAITVEPRKVTTDHRFHLYLLHDDKLVLKETSSLISFSEFGTNKDFLSWLFGRTNQAKYDLYGGTGVNEELVKSGGAVKVGTWIRLAFTGCHKRNRLFKAVHKETGDVYIILTDCGYCNYADHLTVFSGDLTPSMRRRQAVHRLAERNDLTAPPSGPEPQPLWS